MTYAPYIAAAYAIALGVTLCLSAQSLIRLRSASRRLRAIDPRRDRVAQ
ncbi:MAG TPA: heme exporter protein CcmD [Rhodopila sp.]|jgi:heme exporter protein CcmD|nr:heme exporter protein CcmD [Rhodopila sp.]